MHNLFTLLILSSSLLLSQSGNAQETTYSLSTADSLKAAGNLKMALTVYATLYSEDSTNFKVNYNYASAFALNRQVDSAFHYLRIAVVHDSTLTPLTDPAFYYLIEDVRWKTLQDETVAKVEAKYGKYENLPLSKELWTMKLKDQAFYYHYHLVEKQLGADSPVARAIWELKAKINEENINRLVEIIETEGWPKISVVKAGAASAAFMIIQHSDIAVQQKYLPVMRTAAEAGEASWHSLALLIDRVNIREGKAQIYGSQIKRNNDGSYAVEDMIEPEYVNQRRKEVGLGPIEEYVKRWGIVWTVVQKEK
ncbi:MAG: DUF6624 domain-containing protein [Saprospiraceae bacterium]